MVTQELQAFCRNNDNPSYPRRFILSLTKYFIACFLSINTAIYVTRVVLVQNRKRKGVGDLKNWSKT